MSLAVLAFTLLLIPRRWARTSATVLIALLIVLAIPAVSGRLLDSISVPRQLGADAQAIVILSADAVHVNGFQEIEPGLLSLDRLRAGAALYRATRLPVLVTGGLPEPRVPLSAMMAASLRNDFGVPVRWEEDKSRDTWENASLSAPILHAAGIQRVFVVTQHWHMRRALIAFRAAGLDPVPMSIRSPQPQSEDLGQWLPRPAAWYVSYLAAHEWLGTAFYAWRASRQQSASNE